MAEQHKRTHAHPVIPALHQVLIQLARERGALDSAKVDTPDSIQSKISCSILTVLHLEVTQRWTHRLDHPD